MKFLLTKTTGLTVLSIVAVSFTLIDADARGWWLLVTLWLIFDEWFSTGAEREAIAAEQDEDD